MTSSARFAELRLHAQALVTAVEQNRKFFAGIIHYVQQLNSMTAGSVKPTKTELKLLAQQIEVFFRKWRPTGNGFYIPPRQAADSDPSVQQINRLVNELVALSDDDFARELPAGTWSVEDARTVASQGAQCVFIGHGRSRLWARVKAFLEEDLHLAAMTFESESHVGESIVPVLEQMLDKATFAILILTAEDETKDERKRARQNVVHEAGLFQGRLGFKRAVLLVQNGLETFTNVDGLQHIEFSGDNVEQTFYELQRALNREGHVSQQ